MLSSLLELEPCASDHKGVTNMKLLNRDMVTLEGKSDPGEDE